ncbi:MAG TPA: heme biosynthesis HemY N-terminal domain-containing protein [Cellvibrionaceae bacterium]
MKKRLLLVMIAFLLGGFLYQIVREDSGYLLLAFGRTSVEMSLWTALLLWLLVTFVLFLLWRIIQGGRLVGRRLTSGADKWNRRAQSRTMEALIDFIEGNWQVARKKLVKSADKSVSPLVNYLAAARCAYELDDVDGALGLLHKAERARDTSPLAVALTQARMQLNSKRYEQCLATLNRIKRQAPEHPVVLDLLVEVYQQLDDYDALEELLVQIKRLGLKKGEAFSELEKSVYQHQLSRTVVASKNHENARVQLDQVWQRLPGRLQKNPELRAVYAQMLCLLGADIEAEPLLKKSLQQQWCDEWIDLYGRIGGVDVNAQLQQLERWQKERDADALLYAALGRLCLRNQLWGRARDYFRQSLELEPKPEVYAELARLLQQLGDHDAAFTLYQQGLLQVTPPLPDLPQPKNSLTNSQVDK